MTQQIQTSTPDLQGVRGMEPLVAHASQGVRGAQPLVAHASQGVRGAQPPVACDDLDREISPYDTEAEPEDLAAMELALSETTEDDAKLTADEQNELCGEGLQEPSGYPPEGGCCDMSPEQYDPLYADGIPQDGSLCDLPAEQAMADEIEQLVLAEPEPPEEDDDNGRN